MMLKIENWFIFAIVALLFFGFWGFFSKLATNYINPKSAWVYQAIGTVIVGIIVLFTLGFKTETHIQGIIFAILTGIAGGLGALFFLFAISRGKTPVVVTTTALYPLVTIILAFLILKEPITLKQSIGIIFALIAMILLSI